MSTNVLLTSWGIDPITGTLIEESGQLIDSAFLPYSIELAIRKLGIIVEVPLDDGEEIHQIEIINNKLVYQTIEVLEVIVDNPKGFLHENHEDHSELSIDHFSQLLDDLLLVVRKKQNEYAKFDCVTLHIG